MHSTYSDLFVVDFKTQIISYVVNNANYDAHNYTFSCLLRSYILFFTTNDISLILQGLFWIFFYTTVTYSFIRCNRPQTQCSCPDFSLKSEFRSRGKYLLRSVRPPTHEVFTGKRHTSSHERLYHKTG
jgi:hypothetical protein